MATGNDVNLILVNPISTMTRRTALITLGGAFVCEGDDKIPSHEELLAKAASWIDATKMEFAILYCLDKEMHESEIRYVDELDLFGNHPTGRKLKDSFDGVLRPSGLDVAALLARARERIRVERELLTQILVNLITPRRVSMTFMCYIPHHVIVCYTSDGIPVGAIELCFTCEKWKSQPDIDSVGPGELLAVAKIVSDLKIPLGPRFPDFKSYEERSQRLERESEE